MLKELAIHKATRWALVTFGLGITCGVLGHYLPDGAWFIAVTLMSGIFAGMGWIVTAD